MEPEWKTYAQRITLDGHAPRTYGKVVRNGKTSYRNYHREIKHGISLVDLIAIRQNELSKKMNDSLERSIYNVLQ